MDGFLDNESRSGDARLTGSRENTGDNPVDHCIEVRIIEDDIRRLAAQLERDLGDMFRSILHHPFPGLRRACEAILSTPGFRTRALPVVAP